MASPWDEFAAVEDTPAPVTQTEAPPADSFDAFASVEQEAPNVTVARMIREGATKEQIEQFVASTGADPAAIGNLDEALVNRGNVRAQMIPAEDQGALAAGVRGAGDMASFGFLDELGGVADTLGATDDRESIWNSEKGFGELLNQNIDANREILQADEANHPVARGVGQLLGGLAIPTGMTGAVFKAGKEALLAGATIREARAIAAMAATRRLAAEGAVVGGAYGAGSAEDGAGERLLGAGVGAASGAAGGAIAGRLLGGRAADGALRSMAVGPSVPTDAVKVGGAAARQGIDVLPADVGGPTTRRLTAAAAQAPLSASPVIKASQRVGDQTQAARDRIAEAVGTALRPEAAGDQARTGALKYIASSSNEARGLYSAAEAASKGASVSPQKAIANLDEHIAAYSETPGGAPALQRLEGLRDALSQGDVSVSGIRNMRTILRQEFIKDGLRGSDIERRVGQVLDAAGDDVVDSLAASGNRNAAALYAKADAAWKARVRTIDQVIKPIIGTRDAPKSGEQITRALKADMQGNNSRAVRFLRSLPPAEQANTRASIIGSLGTANKGAQNAEGDAFSLATFLTHWNDIGETAKRAFFGDEARSALNDLAIVADASKQAQSYANRSNTSGGIWGNLGLLAGGAVASPAAAGAGLGAQLIGGHLLASPRFARWLARAPKTSLGSSAYIERLGRIARAEPVIATEALQLQKYLAGAAATAPTAAAAQDQEAR